MWASKEREAREDESNAARPPAFVGLSGLLPWAWIAEAARVPHCARNREFQRSARQRLALCVRAWFAVALMTAAAALYAGVALRAWPEVFWLFDGAALVALALAAALTLVYFALTLPVRRR